MKKPHSILRIALLILAVGVQGFAQNKWVVRVHPTGTSTIQKQVGGATWKSLATSDNVYSVTVPQTTTGQQALQTLKTSPLVQSVEADATLKLPEAATGYTPTAHKVPALATYTGKFTIPSLLAVPWGPYLNQPAVGLIGLDNAQKKYGYGRGLVAVIDTGVDYTHPLLFLVVNFWQGKDFTSGTSDITGNSDLNQETSPVVDQETSPVVDQETSPVVDGSGTIVLNQETSPVVDQETSPVVDSKLPPDFGHGTMVAGIIHLVAPYARILPIKAFDSNGTGQLSDVVAAIYYAADQGATVINMSFGAPDDSPALEAAIQYAIGKGVVCVAAVPNSNSSAVQYPAAATSVIGVASTSNSDYRSSFSNWGTDVDIAAPGEAVVTTFPFKKYALGWGTSFSAPWVSGTVALLQSVNSRANVVSDMTSSADKVKGLLSGQAFGAGRLDVQGAAQAASK